MPGFRRVAAPALVLTLALALALPLAALAAPADLDIDRLLAESRAARAQEAALKQRNAQAQMLALFERTINQEQYDVQQYDLRLSLNPSTQTLTGTNIITAEVTGTAISTFELDLNMSMSVTACTAGGVPIAWTHSADLLTITLDRTYTNGEEVEVSVSYRATPAASPSAGTATVGQPMIWTLSEPFGARQWWPCKDLNTDKAETMDITVTVPSDLIVASNGALRLERGQRQRHADLPLAYPATRSCPTSSPSRSIPTASLGLVHAHGRWRTMEVRFFVYPDDVGNGGRT